MTFFNFPIHLIFIHPLYFYIIANTKCNKTHMTIGNVDVLYHETILIGDINEHSNDNRFSSEECLKLSVGQLKVTFYNYIIIVTIS